MARLSVLRGLSLAEQRLSVRFKLRAASNHTAKAAVPDKLYIGVITRRGVDPESRRRARRGMATYSITMPNIAVMDLPSIASTYRSIILKLPKQPIYPEHPIVRLDRERLHCKSRSHAKVARIPGIGGASKFGEARSLLLMYLGVQQNQKREIRKRAICAKGCSVHTYQYDDSHPKCTNNPPFHFSPPRHRRIVTA
jgi:hypothetical protein